MNGTVMDLGKPQKILVAAADLPEVFSESELIVAAWKADPRAFGMRGMEDAHPCSNSVRTYLVGDRGLPTKGFLLKRGQLRYSLTEQGRDEVERIRDGSTPPTARRRALARIEVPRALGGRIAGLLGSLAYRRWLGGSLGMVLVPDARAFLALDPAGAFEEGTGYLVNHELALPGGRVVTARELDQIDRCRDDLVKAFGRRLERKAVPA